MLKSLMLASAMIVAAPALAQSADKAPNPNAATPATPAQPADPATEATPAQPANPAMDSAATPATPAQPATQAANPTDAVAQVVQQEWATYDADKDGALNKDEFGKWMVALRERSPQQQPVNDLTAWTAAAFAQADKDKSSTVTQTELQTFLRG